MKKSTQLGKEEIQKIILGGLMCFGVIYSYFNLLLGPLTKRQAALHEMVPWFIVGFLLLASARSLGLIPLGIVEPIRTVASILTTIAMAALGLGVDVRTVAKAGPRVTAAVTLSLVVLGGISFALIRFAALP